MTSKHVSFLFWLSFLLKYTASDDVTEYGMTVKLRHLSETDRPEDYEAECSILEVDTTYVIDFIRKHGNMESVLQEKACERSYYGRHTLLTCKINIESSKLHDGSITKCELKDKMGNRKSVYEIGEV